MLFIRNTSKNNYHKIWKQKNIPDKYELKYNF